ncbi:MAG: DUF3606 domain-containing protein [Pseudolabrys sp.]
MSDDKSKTVADWKRINIHKDYELRFWSKKFGVSPNELRRAVSKVGSFADDVAREFGILEVRDEPFVGILAMRDAQLICP